jgi:hypothetical protein
MATKIATVKNQADDWIKSRSTSFRFRIKDVYENHNFDFKSSYSSTYFTLEQIGRNYLEVDEEYVFCNPLYESSMKDKKFLSASLTINKQEKGAKKGISNCGFFKEYENIDDGLEPGSLAFNIFLNDKEFNQILNDIKIKNYPTIATLAMKGIKYGWEPDGRHTIWETNEKKKFLEIEGFGLQHKHIYEDDDELEFEKDLKENKENQKKQLIQNFKQGFYAILFLLVLIYFKIS